MDDKIARLYVYDERGEKMGRLVVDIERLIEMYSKAFLRTAAQGNESPGEIMREQTIAPRGDQDELHKKITEHVAWWRKASDGTFYLKRVPEAEVDER